jgi:hypothetical protein
MDPSMSVCLSRFSQQLEPIVAQQWDPRFSIVAQQSPGMTLVQEWPEPQQWLGITLVQEWPNMQRWSRMISVQQRPTWRDVKNTFGMSVHSKESTFPVLFLLEIRRTSIVMLQILDIIMGSGFLIIYPIRLLHTFVLLKALEQYFRTKKFIAWL